MDNVATISVDGKDCVITDKSETQLTFNAPELEVGDYALTGTTTDGAPLLFIN